MLDTQLLFHLDLKTILTHTERVIVAVILPPVNTASNDFVSVANISACYNCFKIDLTIKILLNKEVSPLCCQISPSFKCLHITED